MSRMRILSSSEQETFDTPPKFSHEPGNRFTRAIAVGSPREFTQAEREEQEIAEAC